jgi:hypothetical protein
MAVSVWAIPRDKIILAAYRRAVQTITHRKFIRLLQHG